MTGYRYYRRCTVSYTVDGRGWKKLLVIEARLDLANKRIHLQVEIRGVGKTIQEIDTDRQELPNTAGINALVIACIKQKLLPGTANKISIS